MTISDAIRTPRLLIRNYRKEDREFCLSLWCDEENGRYMSDPARKNIDEKYLACIDEMEDNPEGYYLIAELRETGMPVGTCCVFSESGNCDIGYCVSKDHWREGLGTEMVGALISLARALGGKSVTGEVADVNRASVALLRGLGFREERKARYKKWGEDTWFDSCFYRLDLE